MGIYSPEIEEKLLNTPMADNPLFKYDNYTYHIQLFAVDRETQKDYTESRFRSFLTSAQTGEEDSQADGGVDTSSQAALDAYEVIKDKKVIIAESGVTNDVSIEELVMKSIPGYGDNKTFTASTEFKLRLKETAGNGLVNRIHMLMGLLGYESYIGTPIFLSLWFTGYDNTNKEKPIPVITENFNGISEFVYQVIIEEVSTTVELNQTTYNMTLRPYTDIGLASDYTYINNQQFEVWDRTLSFEQIVNRLITKKNEELKEVYKDFYYGIYGNNDVINYTITVKDEDSEFFEHMIKINSTEKTQMEQDLEFLEQFEEKEKEIDKVRSWGIWGDENKVADSVEKWVKDNYSRYKDIVSRYKGHSTKKYMSEYDNYTATIKGIGETARFKELRGRLIDAIKSDMQKVDPNSPEFVWPGGMYKPETSANICSIIADIWRICSPKSDLIPTFTFIPVYAGDYENRSYYYITLNIAFNRIPGLLRMIDGVKSGDYYDDAPEEQKEYLDYILAHYALIKRYHYLLNGKDTSVLSYDVKEDNLWFLNAGVYDDYNATAQTPFINQNDIIEVSEESEHLRKYKNLIKDMVRNKISLIKSKNKYKNVNMNDLISLVTKETSAEIQSIYYRASQCNDIKVRLQHALQNSNNNKDDVKDDTDKFVSINSDMETAKIAAENMLSHNQKLHLKMKILGDPFWISFSTEDYKIIGRTMPHLIMCTKTFVKNDENDQPIIDEMMSFNTIYTITSIISTFSNGTFTQDLEGSVPPPFVQQYIPEENDKVVGRYEDELLQQSIPIHQDAHGRLYYIDSNKTLVGYESNDKLKMTVAKYENEKRYANTSWNDDNNKMSRVFKESDVKMNE